MSAAPARKRSLPQAARPASARPAPARPGSARSLPALLTLTALLGACSTPGGGLLSPFGFRSGGDGAAPENVEALFDDARFLSPGHGSIEPVALYALPAAVRQSLDRELAGRVTQEQRYRVLRRWAFRQADRYEYDPGTTVAPGELATVGRINCFSFSVLFVAAARHIGLPADIQLVYSPPDWAIEDANWVLNQHINVTGSIRRTAGASNGDERMRRPTTGSMIKHVRRTRARTYVVDLNPDIVVNVHRTERLKDHQVLARFYGNKAAEALIGGDRERAYRYSRLALAADPAASAVWTNLGVLYARSNRPELARQAYLAAIRADADADSARNNLALLYRALDRDAEAEQIERTIHSRRTRNPYYHHQLGRNAFRSGAHRRAIEHYRKAIRRKRGEPLFYLSLAEAQIALGRREAALETLERARRHAEAAHAGRLATLEQAAGAGG